MSRPPLEVADLIRGAGDCLHRTKPSLAPLEAYQSVAGHSRVAAPPPWAVISMSAPAAGIVPPSRITAAGIGTARSVRPLPGNAGSLHVNENFSRPATSMSSSRSHAGWHHWPCRTKRSSTISCFAPVPKHFSKSLAIPDISARRSASSACYTPGIRSSSFIRMSIASFPPAACRPITPAGLLHASDSFFPSRCFAVSSAASLSPLSSRPSRLGQLNFHGDLHSPRSAEDLRRLATTSVPQ